jgi:ubiquitin-protein ligase
MARRILKELMTIDSSNETVSNDTVSNKINYIFRGDIYLIDFLLIHPITNKELILNANFSNSYPFRSPTLRITNINEHPDLVIHPNVYKSGDFCLDKLNNWKPQIKMTDIIEELMKIIILPNPEYNIIV